MRKQIRGTNRSQLSILPFSPFLFNADNHEDSIEVFNCSTASGQEQVLNRLVG